MLLAIDAGNRNVTFAIFEQNKIYAQWCACSSIKRTADEWASWLFGLLSIAKLDEQKINATLISCVVPSLLSGLTDFCTHHLGHQPQIIGQDHLDLGLDVEVGNPAEVGADLLAVATAAKELYGSPSLILDMGTATTLTLVNSKGNFAGVAIALGRRRSQSRKGARVRLPA